MKELLGFLTLHGYTVVFFYVFADQAGLPLPSAPVLLAAGALGGLGSLSAWLVFILATLGSLAGDAVWFALGRFRGRWVLNLVCRVSLEPDFCVRKTQNSFEQHGERLLLFSKFLPGLGSAAPPLTAVVGMPFAKFLVWDLAGSAIWAGAFVGAGYLFRTQLEDAAAYLAQLGAGLLLLASIILAAYVIFKFIGRRRFLRTLRTERITVEELMSRIQAGTPPAIADLRHRLDLTIMPETIPGAIQVFPEEMPVRYQDLPRDRELVLYCSCPNEATSARVALQLRRMGITAVRPLAGGFEAWLRAGFPVEPLLPATARQL